MCHGAPALNPDDTRLVRPGEGRARREVIFAMTLDEFAKNHPGCRVGLPFPDVTLIMSVFCVGVVVLMGLVLGGFRLSESHSLRDLMSPVGAICLMFSFFAGAVMCVKRTLEVLGWRARGHCAFAVAGDEAFFVGEKGQTVLVPAAEVVKLEIHVHTVRIKMKPGFAQADALDRLVSEVLQPGGVGAGGREFFKAFLPAVRQHSPAATIENEEPQSFLSILKG